MFDIENGVIVGTTTAEGEGQIQHRIKTHRWSLTEQHAIDAFPYIHEGSTLARWMIERGLAELRTDNPIAWSGTSAPVLCLTARGLSMCPQREYAENADGPDGNDLPF